MIKHDEVPFYNFADVLSTSAISLMRGLMDKNPKTRLKIPAIKQHPFFDGIDWKKVMAMKLKPPHKPADEVRVCLSLLLDLLCGARP